MPTRASTSKSQEPEPASKEVDEPEADDVEEEQEEDDDDEGEYEVDKVIAHRPDGPVSLALPNTNQADPQGKFECWRKLDNLCS